MCVRHIKAHTLALVGDSILNTNKFAPYAPFGCVIAIIRRFREKGLPETLTLQDITRAGVSEGNASRTMQALKFLKLVDEEGYRTQTFDRLGRVPTIEYAEVFGEIIKEAYKDVFVIIDPADSNDVEINDAFRYYQPQAQRGRMVTLFRGLCQEAGLIAGEPPETRKRIKAVKEVKSSQNTHTGNSRKSQVETTYATPSSGSLNGNVSDIGSECTLLQGLIQQLPPDKKWTQGRRDRWLQAFIAYIDLLIDVEVEVGGN
jgi:hypothetical protein